MVALDAVDVRPPQSDIDYRVQTPHRLVRIGSAVFAHVPDASILMPKRTREQDPIVKVEEVARGRFKVFRTERFSGFIDYVSAEPPLDSFKPSR